MMDNTAKRTLASGKPVMSLLLNFAHAGLTEYLARLGFNCFMMEGEHKGFSDDVLENIARVCDLTGATLLAHVPVNAPMQRYLATGVAGFHIPQIACVSQACEVIDAVKFPPLGRRGIGIFRSNEYGLSREPWVEVWERSNAETLIALAIEDAGGVEAIPDLVRMAAVDVIHIGQGDLSASLGFPGQTKHRKVQEVIDRAIAAILAGGKVAGLGASSPAEVRAVYERGVRFILTPLAKALPVGTDALLNAMRELT